MTRNELFTALAVHAAHIINKDILIDADTLPAELAEGYAFGIIGDKHSVISWSNYGTAKTMVSVWYDFDSKKAPGLKFFCDRPAVNRRRYGDVVGAVFSFWLEDLALAPDGVITLDAFGACYLRQSSIPEIEALPKLVDFSPDGDLIFDRPI